MRPLSRHSWLSFLVNPTTKPNDLFHLWGGNLLGELYIPIQIDGISSSRYILVVRWICPRYATSWRDMAAFLSHCSHTTYQDKKEKEAKAQDQQVARSCCLHKFRKIVSFNSAKLDRVTITMKSRVYLNRALFQQTLFWMDKCNRGSSLPLLGAIARNKLCILHWFSIWMIIVYCVVLHGTMLTIVV